MERIRLYLEIVPPWVLAAVLIVGAVVGALTPRRLRLPLSLAVVSPWLLIGRLDELGTIAAAAKATGVVPFLLIAGTALVDVRPKRRLSPAVYMLPLITIMTFGWVMSADEKAFAAVIALQWTILALAAIAVARCMTDWGTARDLFFWIAIGSGVSILILFTAIIRDPGGIFRAGLGRFEPYGGLSNHIGPIFIVGVPLCLYYGLISRSMLMKLALLGVSGLGLLMVMLTASRSAVFPVGLLLLVAAWDYRKQLIPLGLGVALLGGALFIGRGLLAEASVGRLMSLETDRERIFAEYVSEILKSPVVGRLFGRPAEQPGGTHPHNAYLLIAYEYGLILAAPFSLLILASFVNSVKVWRQRMWAGTDHRFVLTMVVMLTAALLHGMTTLAIFYPTYTWAFVFALLLVLFLSPPPMFGASGYDEYNDDYDWDWDDGSTDFHNGYGEASYDDEDGRGTLMYS